MADRLSRDRVVERAAELADEIGLEGVTITRLGRALGISPPGVYRHVADVVDLRAAIGAAAARQVSGVLSSACAGLAGREALEALTVALRGWAQKHPGRYAALQVAPLPGDREGQEAGADAVEAVVAALRAYDLHGDDLTDAVRLVRSTVHGFITLERDGGFARPRRTEVTLARIVDALDTALRHWS